jgi:ABC-type branched-subunit amino acid transport system ATPase component
VMAVVGGLGTLSGPILGAIVFTYLPEKLQFFAEWQFMVYGLLLMLSFLLLPKGVAGLLLPRTRYIKRSAEAAAAALSTKAPVAVAMPGRLAAGSTPLLVVDNVALSFLGVRALDGVSLEIAPGQVVGLVGPNGSGKSTLVNIISGIYCPNAGAVSFEGRQISGMRDHLVARMGILRTFQDPRLVKTFTVRENVLLGTHRLYHQGRLAAGLDTPQARHEEAAMLAKVDEAIALVGMSSLANSVVSDLPYGDQRMTELCRVLVADPRLVLLDEPAAGLSESELGKLADVISLLQRRGVSVVLIEHHMDFLDDLVDEVVVLESGKLIYRGSMTSMYRNPAVVAAYLGTDGKLEVEHA